MHWRVPQDAPSAGAALEMLSRRFPALIDPAATPLPARFAAGEIVDPDGRAWGAQELLSPGDELWFHRELRPEQVPDIELRILHRDGHLLVLDKPHDMATMPRGMHILASALVRLRRETGIETLVPLHRLDRRTAGVLAFGIRPEERSAYQQLFARAEVEKEYEARIIRSVSSTLPRRPGESCQLRDHLVKRRGELTSQVLSGVPNAESELEVIAAATERDGEAAEAGDAEESGGVLNVLLRPRTGRTHQLRVQLASRGAPILGEDLYWPAQRPRPSEQVWPEGLPLQLLARRLRFMDPITGAQRDFRSSQALGMGSRTLGP
ncbi:pseudouridine synthase [Brachybacterium paraconglomeratum]